MRFMNDFDLSTARRRFGQGNTPNRLALALVVDNLREQTDLVSDGWTYWPKPVRAARAAIELIDSTTNAENDRQEREDVTAREVIAAVRPIKSFLTRHADIYDPHQREIILRAVADV